MNAVIQPRFFRIIEAGALLLILVFWIFYGVLSFYNRFATDDYSMIALVNHRGIIGGTSWFYLNWSGGVFCILFQVLSIAVSQGFKSLLLYNMFLLGFVSAAMFAVIGQLVKKYNLGINNIQNFIIGQLFIQALFFSGFSISENWFWVVGSTGYIYPIAIVLFSIAFFIRYQRLNHIGSLALCLLFAFFFGTYPINYCATFVAACGLVFGLKFLREKKPDFAAISYMVAVVAGMVINVLAPGNLKRMQVVAANKDASIVTPSFVHEIVYIPFFILKKLALSKLVYILIFCLPAVYLLVSSLQQNRFFSTRNTLWLLCFFVMAIYINVVIMFKALGWGLGSYRSLLHINFLLILLIVFSGTLFLRRFATAKIFQTGIVLCIAAGLYFNCKSLYVQYPIVKKYAQAHDNRTDAILNAAATFKGSILYLDPLPASGLLLTAEISTDTSNYVNVDMKSRYDLPFPIALKPLAAVPQQ